MNQAVNLYLSANRFNNKKALLFLTGLFLFLTPLSAQHLFRGLLLEDDRYDALPLPIHYGKTQEIPKAFSLEQYTPRIITQAATNSAVTWSVVWYANTIAEAKRLNISADHIAHKKLPLAPAYTYRRVAANEGCDEAISLVKTLESLHREGAPRFMDFPEFCSNTIPELASAKARTNKLPGYARIFNSYDPKATKIHAMKKALASGSPVVMGFICPPSFQFAKEFWQPRELDPLPEYGGHAVCVIGYDDLKFGGAFKVVNSWGNDWGSGGKTWIRYDDIAAFLKYAFEIIPAGSQLEGAVKFFTTDGAPMAVAKRASGVYAFTQPYKTGSPFKLQVLTRDGIFCAVVAEDPLRQRARLFPADTMISSFVRRTLSVPDDPGYYTLTEPAGKNVIYLVFSNNAARLMQYAERLIKTGEAIPLDEKNSKWAPGDLQFETTQETIIVAVELDQI